jgi:hypothetical protein
MVQTHLISFRPYSTDTCSTAEMNTYGAVLAPEFGAGRRAVECSSGDVVSGLMFRGSETKAQVQFRVCAPACIELEG